MPRMKYFSMKLLYNRLQYDNSQQCNKTLNILKTYDLIDRHGDENVKITRAYVLKSARNIKRSMNYYFQNCSKIYMCGNTTSWCMSCVQLYKEGLPYFMFTCFYTTVNVHTHTPLMDQNKTKTKPIFYLMKKYLLINQVRRQ